MLGLSAAGVGGATATKTAVRIKIRVGNWETIYKVSLLALCATGLFLLSNCKAVCRRFYERRSRSLSFYPAARSERNRCHKSFHPSLSYQHTRNISRHRGPAGDRRAPLSSREPDPVPHV